MAKKKTETPWTDESKAQAKQNALDIQSITAGLEPAHATPNEFLIPLDLIDGPAWNHRQRFENIKQLANSIAEHGQQEAVKVRPGKTVGRFEIVYGERRWRAFGVLAVRGGQGAKNLKMRCVIDVLNDRGVVIAQAVENLDRSNPHPLEEALIYERLLKSQKDGGEGMTMLMVQQRLRRSPEHITDRMELLKICPEARTAYLEDKFTDAHALLVARIPDASMQMRFVRDILALDDPGNEGRLMPIEQAKKHVKKFFMLPLAQAPFSGSDTTLVPGVGACGTCPHNTRTQTILFRDIEPEAAYCVNVPCYERKADAQWARRSEQARANGQDVLSEQDARAIWPFPGSNYASPNAPYVPLSSVCHEFEPPKSYDDIVRICESVGHHVTRAIARRPGTTEIHELVTTLDARSVVSIARSTMDAVADAERTEEAPHDTQDAVATPSPTGELEGSREDRWKQIQEEAQRNKREQTQQHRAAMGVFIQAFLDAPEEKSLLAVHAVAKRFVQNCLVETLREVVARRGLKPNGNVNKDRGMRAEPEAALLAWLDRTTDDMAVSALILELVLTKDATTTNDPFVGLREALTAFGIREEDARQGRAEPEAPKASKEKRPAPRKRASSSVRAHAGT